MKRVLSFGMVLIFALMLCVPVSAAGAGWKQSGGRWWYQYADGGYPADAWQKIGGKWYHFDALGYMQTGWQEIDGNWYYFKSSGEMATSWQKIGNTWYYFKASGAMQTGWMNDGRVWYYFRDSGSMHTGWLKSGDCWYFFSPSGSMYAGKWLKSGNSWYYFKDDGRMAANEKVDGYAFGSNGVWIPQKSVSFETKVAYFSTHINSFDENTYYEAIVEVTNTGYDSIYLKNAVFDIEDGAGHLLATDDYISTVPSVIAPGETGYIYSDGDVIGKDVPKNIKLVPTVTAVKATGTQNSYPVSDVSTYANDYGTIGVKGRITNNTDKEISYLYVRAVAFDAKGTALGIAGTSVTDIAPGNRGSFDISGLFMHDPATPEKVSRVAVYALDSYYQWN